MIDPADPTWVVVVNFGLHELIEANLTAGPDPVGRLPVVVVDNWHSPAERAAIIDVCRRHGWLLVGIDANPGFGAAVNAGVRAAADAGAGQLVLLNPDAVTDAGLVLALGRQVATEPSSLVSPVVRGTDGSPYFHGSRVDLRSGRIRGRTRPDAGTPDRVALSSAPPWRDWLSGCCLAFGTDLWRRAGGFDEDYFLYWEDVDFSQRCVAVGARLWLRTDLVVRHDEGASHGVGGSRARSATYYRYNCRNRLAYAARHLGRVGLLGWMVRTPSESRQILLRGGRRQLLESPRPLLATVRGSLEGLGLAAVALIRGRP